MVKVTFRNLEASDAIRDYAVEKVEKAAKYLYREFNAQAILATEKFWQVAEIVVTGEGHTCVGSARREDMYSAIDAAMHKVEVQLRRYKDRNHVPSKDTGEFERPKLVTSD